MIALISGYNGGINMTNKEKKAKIVELISKSIETLYYRGLMNEDGILRHIERMMDDLRKDLENESN